jgi:hypothetical protein
MEERGLRVHLRPFDRQDAVGPHHEPGSEVEAVTFDVVAHDARVHDVGDLLDRGRRSTALGGHDDFLKSHDLRPTARGRLLRKRNIGAGEYG